MSGPYRIGPFVIDPARGLVTHDGKPVAVGQRAMALLLALIAAEGKPVAKADLMEAGWPGLAVEEGNLTVQIAALRKALGPGPQGQDWIVTVPRVGYRLMTTSPSAAVGVSATRPVVAVLPFQNLSGDADAEYFADGIVADIITALSRFRSLAVLSRNSSFAYRGRTIDTRTIAHDLGAGYLLEGSVRRSGDRLRITAQLVEGDGGVTLWTNRFDGDLSEIFDFQDRITESVATLVAPAIEASELVHSRQQRPESAATYDLFLRARAYIDDELVEGNAKGYALLTDALRREPDNALILAHAAWALEHRTAMGWPPIGPDDHEKCVEHARNGIRLANGNPRVMAHCAVALVQTGKDYDGGMAVIEQAAAANPNDLYVLTAAGVLTMHCGDLDRAMDYFDRALRLGGHEPHSRFALTGIAHVQILRGNFDAALDFAARSLAINDRFDASYWMLIAANAHLGRMEEAHVWREALLTIAPGITIARILRGQPAKYPERFAAILNGLRLAHLPEG